MPRTHSASKKSLAAQFPPSPPCECSVCLAFCARPGWWTVEEAARALSSGLGPRMMLELAPDRAFGVLSPAFRGNEGALALEQYAKCGCGFLREGKCELHGTPLMPLECRYCHHERLGMGPICHEKIAQDWRQEEGYLLVARWARQTGTARQLALLNFKLRGHPPAQNE